MSGQCVWSLCGQFMVTHLFHITEVDNEESRNAHSHKYRTQRTEKPQPETQKHRTREITAKQTYDKRNNSKTNT